MIQLGIGLTTIDIEGTFEVETKSYQNFVLSNSGKLATNNPGYRIIVKVNTRLNKKQQPILFEFYRKSVKKTLIDKENKELGLNSYGAGTNSIEAYAVFLTKLKIKQYKTNEFFYATFNLEYVDLIK